MGPTSLDWDPLGCPCSPQRWPVTCRQTPLTVSTTQPAASGLSVLSLHVEVLDPDDQDWPVVTIRVDGHDPFAAVAKYWRGFDPAKILGADSPLIPREHGQRVAVYRCSCGEAGCGVIAPFISASSDGRRISWTDFRNYVGVFADPATPGADEHEGKPWRLPALHFDRDQYLAEVRRAADDQSWETPHRRTARLVHERLAPLAVVLPPDLKLAWVVPAWKRDGVVLLFEHSTAECAYHELTLHLTSAHSTPDAAAEDMVDQLLGVSPDDWARTFGDRT